MYRISIGYINKEEMIFDLAYFREKHMPMVAGFCKDVVKSWGVEEGVSFMGRTPIYRAIGYMYVESLEAFMTSFGVHGKEISADVAKFTNQQPQASYTVVMDEH